MRRMLFDPIYRREFLFKIGIGPKIPAFLHVPKTGGTYLAQRESNMRPVISPLRYLGHHWVVQSLSREGSVYPPKGFRLDFAIEKRALIPYFIFTTVRNPFSFLVSYMWHAGGINSKYRDPNHYDFEVANKGFDYLLNTIINREEPWPSRKLIHGQLFCDDGDLIVDWINRNESLDSDLESMAATMNIDYQRRAPQRVGRDDDYRTYYSDQSADLVSTTWKRELMLFGYEFDGYSKNPAVLAGEITRSQKDGVKYYWERDVLTVDPSLRVNERED